MDTRRPLLLLLTLVLAGGVAMLVDLPALINNPSQSHHFALINLTVPAPAPPPTTDDIRQRLKQVSAELQGPLIVVGGIGDSGTRGVHALLRHLGVKMLAQKPYVNPAHDSLIGTTLAFIRPEDGHTEELEPHNITFAAIRAALQAQQRPLAFNYTARDVFTNNNQLDLYLDWVARMVHNTQRVNGSVGFKFPQSALLLPLFHEAFGSSHQLKFIHVVRDGREVVRGENTRQFRMLCPSVMGDIKWCRTGGSSERFWSRMNLQVLDYATKHLPREAYHVVRSEDLVAGNRACYADLARFVGRHTAAVTDEFVNHTKQYASRYFGQAFSPTQRAHVAEVSHSVDEFAEALAFWGYADEHAYANGTAQHAMQPCSELAWRKKKKLDDRY